MVNTIDGPEAAYPGPDDKAPDTEEKHDSGLERASSEPGQGTGERPADWDPPPDNTGAEQDADRDREKEGVKTDSLIDAE